MVDLTECSIAAFAIEHFVIKSAKLFEKVVDSGGRRFFDPRIGLSVSPLPE
jgi:hypothetical protein